MKVYGNEPTRLKLTPRAQKTYNETDPLTIIEEEQGGAIRYTVRGCIEMENATEAEVIEALESF